jgi:hypothetical protein
MPSMFTDLNDIHIGSVAVADATTETTSAIEDMADYDEITWIVLFEDVDAAAVLTLQPKSNTADHLTVPAPVAISVVGGTVSGAVTAVVTTGASVITEASANLDNLMAVVNVAKSKISARYVFLSITATVESFAIASIITIKSRAGSVPVTQSTDVASLVKAAS